jgi:hypothetical protein
MRTRGEPITFVVLRDDADADTTSHARSLAPQQVVAHDPPPLSRRERLVLWTRAAAERVRAKVVR